MSAKLFFYNLIVLVFANAPARKIEDHLKQSPAEGIILLQRFVAEIYLPVCSCNAAVHHFWVCAFKWPYAVGITVVELVGFGHVCFYPLLVVIKLVKIATLIG